jgi:hypothetical protein
MTTNQLFPKQEDLLKSTYQDLYQKILDDKYVDDFYTTAITPQWTVQTTSSPTINNINNYPTYYNHTISTSYPFNGGHNMPQVGTYDSKVEVILEDGKRETITREELVKYIGERKQIQENELVRTLYDRYQVAAKLARSDDNGDTGV